MVELGLVPRIAVLPAPRWCAVLVLVLCCPSNVSARFRSTFPPERHLATSELTQPTLQPCSSVLGALHTSTRHTKVSDEPLVLSLPRDYSRWSRDAFLSRHGTLNTTATIFGREARPVSMKEAAERLNATNTPHSPGVFAMGKPQPKTQTLIGSVFADYGEAPRSLQQLHPRVKAHQVVSILPKGVGLAMHHHGATWFHLVAGRKVWIFQKPHSEAFIPQEKGPCGHMHFLHQNPAFTKGRDIIACVQQTGDIIWMPTMLLHATCALDEWTVGVGAQIHLDEDMPLSSRVPEKRVGMQYDESWRKMHNGSQYDESWRKMHNGSQGVGLQYDLKDTPPEVLAEIAAMNSDDL